METKKLESIHRKGTRTYTGTFRTSSVESLHVEAYDPFSEMRKHVLYWD